MKEVKLKRFAGPYENIPFDTYIQSPIGLVPKDGGKDCRLIFHLSYPRGGKTSVNANTDPNLCSVKYPGFDQAIQLCIKAGKYCKLGKSDMTSAFRNLRIKKSHWRFLILKAESPFDGKTYYFIDKCLQFGASISCAHFQNFSDAVAHIAKTLSNRKLINYLDDFLFVALLKAICDGQMVLFMDICRRINFPVSLEKTVKGTTVIIFLGLLIDSVNQTISIPIEKIAKAETMIADLLSKKKMTLKQLQKICGFLNFLGRCIVPGHTFTRCMYMTLKGKTNLKPHHHLRISAECHKDLTMWLQFIQHPSIYCRSFMDMDSVRCADEIFFYTDASQNSTLGFGGICDRSWNVWTMASKFCRAF